MISNTAVLITCFNRKEKTLMCLESLYQSDIEDFTNIDVYVVDDGLTDGTADAIASSFPKVVIIKGNGNLYWAGGMRLAWNTALKKHNYSGFLLLNDDVELYKNFFSSIIKTHNYSINKYGVGGVFVSSTIDRVNKTISYGGRLVVNKGYKVYFKLLKPEINPVSCQITNANILFVSNNVVEEIGVLNDKFTHGIADYDYSLVACKHNIPVLLCPEIGGVCADDHVFDWKTKGIKDRVVFLYSVKGLAYKEYLYFVKKHFPTSLPYAFCVLWIRTLFPSIWNKKYKR